MLVKLAWKNLWRNRNRTIITMASIFFAVILTVLTTSLQEGTFNNLVKNVVSFYSGYAQVHKQGYWDEQILDNSFELSPGMESRILQDKNVTAITPRLESFALASANDITKGSLVVGIEPGKEHMITLLRDKLVQGAYINDKDNAVLLADGLAKRLRLNVGDTIILIGQGYHGSTAAGKYPVKGIVKFGSPDLNDKALFMPLVTAQDLYSAYGMITSFILSLDNTDELNVTANSVQNYLGQDYEVMTWEQMMPDIKQHIQSDTNNMKYIAGVLYLLVCFGIFGTLLMMMVERKFEMGMLVAIGMKKTKMVGLFLFESFFSVLLGCVLGIIASIPVVYYFNRHPLRFGGETAEAYSKFGFEPIFPTSLNPSNFIDQGLTVLIIGLLLSLYPIYKVIRLNPVTAMKR